MYQVLSNLFALFRFFSAVSGTKTVRLEALSRQMSSDESRMKIFQNDLASWTLNLYSLRLVSWLVVSMKEQDSFSCKGLPRVSSLVVILHIPWDSQTSREKLWKIWSQFSASLLYRWILLNPLWLLRQVLPLTTKDLENHDDVSVSLIKKALSKIDSVQFLSIKCGMESLKTGDFLLPSLSRISSFYLQTHSYVVDTETDLSHRTTMFKAWPWS